MFSRVIFQTLLCVIVAACTVENETLEDLQSLSDPEIRKIFEFQDQRDADSLTVYFEHPNPLYRAAAAKSFASVQDSIAIPKLFSLLLNDDQVEVRKAAAFSVGQMYDSAAAQLLLNSLVIETSPYVRKTILEAIGKCVTQSDLSSYNTYQPVDSSEKEGFMWGLYYAGLRNVFDDISVEVAVSFLKREESFSTRLAAANFLGRTSNLKIGIHIETLLESIKAERSSEIRMQIALALEKSKDERAVEYQLQFLKDSDPRVRINSIRSFSKTNDEKILERIVALLSDEDIGVSIAASEMLENNGGKIIAKLIENLEFDFLDWRVKSNLYNFLLQDGQENLISQIKIEYELSENDNEKGSLLSLIGRDIGDYEFIVTETFSTSSKVVRDHGIWALWSLRSKDDFPKELSEEFAEIFIKAIRSENPDLMYRGAYALVNKSFGYEEALKESMLSELKQKAIDLKYTKTIGILNEQEEGTEDSVNEKPIDWNRIPNLRDEELAVIVTSKGDIQVRLTTSESPASVINFLQLADENYYDGVAFHRVVPNFVVQGGWNTDIEAGSKPFTIRSEFNEQKYRAGTIGMASAGKDTEGTQFFFTHSPTPHLEGKYTIFGYVTSGMDVVNTLQIGDKIIDINRLE